MAIDRTNGVVAFTFFFLNRKRLGVFRDKGLYRFGFHNMAVSRIKEVAALTDFSYKSSASTRE